MDIRYNVSELFRAAFGINSPVFITEPFKRQAPPNLSFSGLETLPENQRPTGTSWMGTPILFGATFLGDNYIYFQDDGTLSSKAMETFDLPPATMFGFRRAKNINKTPLLGNEGTVKEYFGFDDWIIDVRGLCIDEPNITASQQIKNLLEWEGLADGINVSGELFEMHKISRVCIEDWSDNIQQGTPGVIAFQCKLCSDKPIELVL